MATPKKSIRKFFDPLDLTWKAVGKYVGDPAVENPPDPEVVEIDMPASTKKIAGKKTKRRASVFASRDQAPVNTVLGTGKKLGG